MTDSLVALRAVPEETYKLVKVKVPSKLKERFELSAIPKTKLVNEYGKQKSLQRAASTVPIVERYELKGENKKEKLYKTEVLNVSYGKAWQKKRNDLSMRQKDITLALSRGKTTIKLPESNSRGGIDKDRFIEELGMTVGDRNNLVKKIHVAKNQLSRKISSPSSKLDPQLQTKDPSQEEVNTEKRANIPGNPFHDTFPTIFPVRTITMVTGCADADSLAGF